MIQVSKQMLDRDQFKVSFDNAQIFLNGGKASMELGRLADEFGNHDLSKILSVSGTLASGIGSAMMFQVSGGGMALGYAAGVIGAATSIIATFFADDDDDALGMALGEILHQLGLFRRQIYELHLYLAEFRSELYQKLSVYFNAIHFELRDLEEIYHHGNLQALHHADKQYTLSKEIVTIHHNAPLRVALR